MSDASLFEAFVREYQDMVFATAIRLLANPADAEDVAQTVFLKAFERFADIGSSPEAPGWLKTVTTNLCLNHLSRYRARWRLFSEMGRDDDEGESYEATVAAPGSHAADLEQADEHAVLEGALRRLPTHQRVPLVLFHFEERSYQDIAGLLGVSLGKVKTDIHRGREALRKFLGTDHGPE
jgi:RNA polymerase sigma-70 factor (ECF subfamily)